MALRVFASLHDAKKEGFAPYDRSPMAFIVKREKPNVELAIVSLTLQPSKDPERA